MISKLSFKNVKKSIKDYLIYFFTLVLGIAIFYMFNSIDSQTVMLNINERKTEIISLLTQVLSILSVFVSFILGCLIIYATRFMIKRRNKEFGIYLTLGMGKRKISFILFLETLFIGILSLLIGIFVGVILSQGMSIIVANMFECDMRKFQFVFSSAAMIKTVIYFSIMYIVVMIFNTIVVTKCKLIDLLSANKKNEKVKIKNFWLCLIIFIIGLVALGWAYYLVTDGIDRLEKMSDILKPVILGIVSTFLIIWSLSGILLKIVSKVKKIYFNKLNIFIIRQLSSKINTTVVSMTIICLMLFITICALSSSFSLRNALLGNLDKLSPVDMQIMAYNNSDEDDKYNDLDVLKRFEKNKFDYEEYFDEYVSINLYYDVHFMFSSSLGKNSEKILQQYPYIDDYVEQIITINDYNKMAKLFNLEKIELKDDEYAILTNYDQMRVIREEALKADANIIVFGTSLKPKYKKCLDGSIEISNVESNIGIFVVPDGIIKDNKTIALNVLSVNYKEKNKNKKYDIDNIFKKESSNIGNVMWSFKTDYIDTSIGLSTIITFLGIYLGIIFLISSAAILALKTLSEANDNKMRYEVLRKIGADEKIIRQALFKEILIFFMLPLTLAIIHSIFGMRFALKILEMFGKTGLLKPVVFASITIILIYGGYFLITYISSKRIIKE